MTIKTGTAHHSTQ